MAIDKASPRCYCTQLRRASNGLTRLYDDALRPFGLRVTQFSLLCELKKSGKATIRQLAAASALDKTTMSRNVRLLADMGWVDFLPNDEDAREKFLILNRSGHDVLERASPAWSGAQARIERYMKQHFEIPSSTKLIATLEAFQNASA